MTAWIRISGRLRRVEMPKTMYAGRITFRIDGAAIEVDARMVQPGVISLIVGGSQFRCVLDGDAVIVSGQRVAFTMADPRSLAAQKGSEAGSGGARAIKAPMPGRIVRVLVSMGDMVEEQQGLVVIAAMKMQNELKSPKAGRVVRTTATIGEAVAAGDVLVVIE